MTKITSLTAQTSAATTDNLPIVDNSGTPTTKKITWANLLKSIISQTKGNIPVSDGTTLGAFPVGTNDYILVADSTQTYGVKWSPNTATVEADSLFAPTTTDDGSTAIAITDSTFTTPTTVSSSSVDTSNSTGIDTTTTVNNSSTTGFSTFSTAADSRAGEHITDTTLRNTYIKSVTMNLKKVGSPTGNMVARIRKTSDDSIVGTSGNLDVSTIGTSYGDQTLTFSPSIRSPNEDFLLLVEYSGGNGSNYIEYRWDSSANSYAGGYTTRYNGSYTDYSTSDLRMSFATTDYIGSIKDDKSNPTTKKWQSSSEIGPWFKCDMASAQELLGVAIHFHANTTVTSFKIETSSDDSTYIRRKTVPYNICTAGAWNLILFPRPPRACRYLKVTGLDAGAKVLSINEASVFILTESVINRRHRHLSYTPSNSCTTLLGA